MDEEFGIRVNVPLAFLSEHNSCLLTPTLAASLDAVALEEERELRFLSLVDRMTDPSVQRLITRLPHALPIVTDADTLAASESSV